MTMKKIAVLFPGSGSQYVGMGKTLYEEYQIVKDTFTEADDILEMSISRIILEGSTLKLNKVKNMLAAVYIVNVAYFRVFSQETGVVPQFMAGHSLGEYAALACSGAISFAEGLKIVSHRSQIAEAVLNTNGGTMTILKKIDPVAVLNFCNTISTAESPVDIACYNSPNQVLISGCESAVKCVEKLIVESNNKAEVINLPASPPYHSVLMESKIEDLKRGLQQLNWNEMNASVISNFTALPYTSEKEIIDNLTLQICKPVQWQKTIEYIISEGVKLFIEVGPQNILKNLNFEIAPLMDTYSFDEKIERAKIIDITNIKTQEKELNNRTRSYRLKAISMCLTHAVSTKNYNESGEYNENIIRLYEEIKELKNKLSSNNDEITDHHLMQAFKMLKAFFNTKLIPVKEQEARINDITNRTEVNFEKITATVELEGVL